MVGINTPRTQIALPAQGLQELRDILNNLLEEFGNEDDKGKDFQNSDIYKRNLFSLSPRKFFI
jgi:hypothetical protein